MKPSALLWLALACALLERATLAQAAGGGVGPLMREAIWADATAETVFHESFDAAGARGLAPVGEAAAVTKFSGARQGGGHDGGNCYEVDVELPPNKVYSWVMQMPETDPTGLSYRLFLKLETDPPTSPGQLSPLALELNRAWPPGHTLNYSEPLEEKVRRDGEWLESATNNVFRAHVEYVYRGWVKYEGDTSSFVRLRFDGRRAGEPFGQAVRISLVNRAAQALPVKMLLDDVTYIRRDIYNLPGMRALLETPRPVLRQTRAQILLARKRVAEGEKLPAAVAADLKRADEWLTKEIVVPREQAGWPGGFFCDVAGCKAGLIPAPPEGYKCSKCGKMYVGEKWHQLLVYQQHMANSQATRALGFAWQWTDDPRYARKAEAILLAYADAIQDFVLGHNWLGDTWLMEDFLQGYDYIYESVGEEARQAIGQKFLMVEVLRNYHYNHHYPEGYIQLLRMCTWCALLAKNREWLQYLVFSPTGNREVSFRYGLTDDYVSLKGAAYNGDIIRGLNAVGVTLENCGITFFDDRMKGLYDALPRQIFPDRSLPGFGHCNVGYPVGMYEVDVPYRYYRDPVYLALTSEAWRQDRGARLFWEDNQVPEAAPLKLPSSHLQALGVTFLRAENEATLALSWGAPQRNDPARLDFQYYGAGGHLLWSSGICGYANPYFEPWYEQSLSRNGLVVDEGTQTSKAGRVVYLDLDGPDQAVVAELVDAYPDTRWVRAALLFASGEALLIDRLTSPRARTVDWVCQLPGMVESSVELPATEAPWGKEHGYGVLEGVRGAEAARGLALTVRHKGRGVRVAPAYGEATRVYLAQGRTGTSAVASPVMLLRREGVTDTVFATLLQPFPTDPPAQGRVRVVKRDAKGWEVEAVGAERKYQVRLAETGGELRVTVE